jgi:hypothetical protein
VKSQNKLILLTILLLWGLVACRPGGPVQTVPEAGTATLLPTDTVPAPTPTPSPTPLPEQVLLVSAPAADSSGGARLQEALQNLAVESGLELNIVPSLTPQALGSEVRLVVVAPPGDNLAELAAASPQTSFLAVGIPGLQAGGNLSVIGPQGERPDLQGFLAGYIAAVITDDWRVGVIGLTDVPAGQAASQAFLSGAEYFCGLCNPPFPPFAYPLLAELPAAAAASEWQALADDLTSTEKDVRTIYLAANAGGQDLISYLAGKNINLIGSQLPPNEYKDRWAATVFADPLPALETMWPELMNGSTGLEQPMPVGYNDVNPAIFSPGRQKLVDRLLQDLQAGLIDSGVDPLTGEAR